MKLQQMKQGQCFLCLPKAIVNALQWKKGEDIKILVTPKGTLELKRKD